MVVLLHFFFFFFNVPLCPEILTFWRCGLLCVFVNDYFVCVGNDLILHRK